MTPAPSLAALDAAALAWCGTPYRDNAAELGVGASCHFLPAALYLAAGWEHGLTPGAGPARWSGRRTDSPLEAYMAQPCALAAFTRHDYGPGAVVMPGDMLGFLIGSYVAHAGLALTGGRFVHSIRKTGVAIRALADPSWGVRLRVLWRPRVAFL